MERRKDAAEEGSKKHGPPSQPIGRHDGLNIEAVEAVEAVVARCCQVPPGACLTDLCKSKTGPWKDLVPIK